MSKFQLYLNGINGATGQYLTPPLDVAAAAAALRGEPPQDPQHAAYLKTVSGKPAGFLELPFNVRGEDVPKAGWGVVFADTTPAAVRTALRPLLDRRKSQVQPDRYKELDYHAGESMRDWLQRHGVNPGMVSPTRVPYYLLLAGPPTDIPFEFQYLLDIEYAVGRLAFDRPEQYRQYADSVVAYETAAAVPNGRDVVYWGTRHTLDFATELSADQLLTPLAVGLPDDPDHGPAIAGLQGFRSTCFRGSAGAAPTEILRGPATKANLMEALHAPVGTAPPALLFTASHGIGWPRDDPYQATAQGALLCQDWSSFDGVQPGHYLAAADVDDAARVHGLVAFVFACFGAGTPEFDDFLFGPNQPPPGSAERRLAARPFVAPLPQRLLAHPQGGALAVIGHVDRAWAYSIRPLDEHFVPLPGVGPQLGPFRTCVGKILAGEPVGHTTRDISKRFALHATILSGLQAGGGAKPTDAQLVGAWIERNDAQNYVVLGDPAVRLRVDALK
jgi:hypothetical protein